MAAETACLTSVDVGSAEALRAALLRALQRALPQTADGWSVTLAPDSRSVADREVFMFTIAAHTFRAIALLHFRMSDAISEWVARALHLPRDQVSRDKAYDYLGEVGNNYCGEIKREVHKAYPYLGMSTPNRLRSESLNCLAEHRFAFQAHAMARAGNALQLGASFYVCAYADVDFHQVREEPVAQTASSTLELF
jgi:hypothetical protein